MNRLRKFANESADVNSLCDIDDNIGEDTEIKGGVDYYNRDAAFVDIDGQILVSDEGESHAQLVNKYLDSIDCKELNDDWYRPDVEEIEEKSDGERAVAFGHIVNDNVWIIEDRAKPDISVEDVANDIKASGNKYTKIYSYDRMDVTRVAKLAK